MTTRSRALGISIALMWAACAAAAMDTGPNDSQPQSAPTAPGSSDSGTSKAALPEVIVEARRQALERRAHTFVDKLTHSRRFSNPDQPAPRWEQPLCFEVAGLPRRYAEFVAARLVQIATSVGVAMRKECSRFSANFYVVFTPDPAKTLQYLNHHPTLLQDRPENNWKPIDRFLNPPKSVAVRVWHNVDVMGWSGTPCFVNPSDLLECDADPAGGSRISLSGMSAFARTFVVIDSSRVQGMQLGQISAYVAMVGLVDVDDDVNLGDTPSILRLFTDPPKERADGLTEWDRAFLSALYHTDWRNSQQRGQIVNKMVDEIAH